MLRCAFNSVTFCTLRIKNIDFRFFDHKVWQCIAFKKSSSASLLRRRDFSLEGLLTYINVFELYVCWSLSKIMKCGARKGERSYAAFPSGRRATREVFLLRFMSDRMLFKEYKR